MIIIDAPDGIGEITPTSDLAAVIEQAVSAGATGPLVDGDILVVTSKIISKAEGRAVPVDRRTEALAEQTRRTVSRRGQRFAIVETPTGLVQAAAGIDNSNVDQGWILLLPVDPDASAARLRADLERRTGARLGVIISDTSGRAWRTGQTDHAIGLSGVAPLLSYAGQTDTYGNDLKVTSMAVADELAAAADLAKAKLRGRPVAVIRGLAELLADDGTVRPLLRTVGEDLFRLGVREAVIEAVAAATGRLHETEALYRLPAEELITTLTAGLPAERAAILRRVLQHALTFAPSD